MIWIKVFGRTSLLVGWLFGIVWTRWSFIFSMHPFCLYSIHPFLQTHPRGKYLVRQRIESITFSKQQRRLLPSFLSLSFFYDTCTPLQYKDLAWPALHVQALPPVVADVKAGLTGGIRAQLPHLLVIGLRPPAGNKYNLNRCQIQYKARLKGQHQQVFNTPPSFFPKNWPIWAL